MFYLYFLFTQKESTKEKAPQTKNQSYPFPACLSPNQGRIWLIWLHWHLLQGLMFWGGKPLCRCAASPQGGENSVIFSWITLICRNISPFRGNTRGWYYNAPASTEGEDGNKVNTGKLLEKVLDRGNHDKLIYLLAKRISDKRLLKLIRAYLESGVMLGGLVSPTQRVHLKEGR